MSLIKSSKNLLVPWKDYSINIQRSGRMNNVKEILNTFNNQDVLITGKNSETPSRRQSAILMENLALKSMIYGRLSICHLIWLEIIKYILNYSRKSFAKKLWNGTHFQRKNSLAWLRNVITCQLLDQTSYPRDISRKSSKTLHVSINSLILLMHAST